MSEQRFPVKTDGKVDGWFYGLCAFETVVDFAIVLVLTLAVVWPGVQS